MLSSSRTSGDWPWCIAGVNGRILTMPTGFDTAAPDHTPPTGEAQRLAFDLRDLGIESSVNIRMFADVSAQDGALRMTTARGHRFMVETAPFGGFIAVV